MAPLVLAGTYAIFGLNFIAMKAVLLLFLSATLLLIYFYYWRLSTATTAALVVAITAINPYVWNFRDNIVTEFVFMFFMWASLLLLEVREQSPTLRGQLIAAGLAGAMAYLATATREIGIILIPTVIFYDLLRRRLGLGAAMFVLVFLGGYAAQLAFGLNLDKAYEGDDVNYMHTLFGWSNIADNLFHYVVSLRRIFPGPTAVSALMLTIAAALVAYGVYREWTRFLPQGKKLSFRDLAAGIIKGIRLQDVLAGGYLLAICLLPFRSEPRYLLPILPIAFFYVVVGARHAIERLAPARHASAAAAAVLAAFLLYHGGYYLTAKAAPVQGVGTPQSVQLFNAIRAQLPKDAVVVFRKSRAMALFGQRRSDRVGAARRRGDGVAQHGRARRHPPRHSAQRDRLGCPRLPALRPQVAAAGISRAGVRQRPLHGVPHPALSEAGRADGSRPAPARVTACCVNGSRTGAAPPYCLLRRAASGCLCSRFGGGDARALCAWWRCAWRKCRGWWGPGAGRRPARSTDPSFQDRRCRIRGNSHSQKTPSHRA